MGRVFAQKHKAFIKAHLIGIGNAKMAQMVNETFDTNYTTQQIKSLKHNNKWSSGLDGRFQKGLVPYNKGKKRPGVKSETSFQPGHTPHNHRPVGSERVTDGYVYIKVAEPKTWRLKHVLIWEKHHGKVPKNHVILFADQDKTNFDIDNLILVSRGQLAILNKNKLIFEEPNLTKTGVTITKVHEKIRERKGKG